MLTKNQTHQRVFGMKAEDNNNKPGDLSAVAREFKKAKDEVEVLGRQMLGHAAAGKKSTDDLIKKVDDALSKSGELSQQVLELSEHVARGAKSGGNEESLQNQLESHLAEFPEKKSLLDKPRRGAAIDLPVSRKALTGGTATGQALTYPGQRMPLVLPLLQRLTVRDLLAPGRTTSPVIFYPREVSFTSGAAVVAEAAAKPESNFVLEMITQAVATIAHWTNISLQMLTDIAFIQSYIDGRMLYQLKLIEEGQLLNGSGSGGNILGIYTAATAYAHPTGAETATQALDVLRLMMLQVELAYADTTGIVLNPVDWANLELLKNTQGQYLFTNPQNTTTGSIWGRDVVSTMSMTAGNALVGDFAAHAQILDRDDANVAISFENVDNFIKNIATIRVEERLALCIYRPTAFVKGALAIS